MITEQKMAAEMGVNRSALKALREEHLLEEVDFKKEGREIVLTPVGQERLLEALAKLDVQAEADAKKNAAAGGLGGVRTAAQAMGGVLRGILAKTRETDAGAAKRGGVDADGRVVLRVVRVYPNPRILLAKNSVGDEVRVRVRNSKNFQPGMELYARLDEGDIYNHEGRCPRFKGRW